MRMTTGARILSDLLTFLRTMHQTYWTSHWEASGTTAYGDHLLYERLYTGIVDEIDTLAEKLMSLSGPDALNHSTTLLTEWTREDRLEIRGLHMEEYLQRMIRHARDVLEKNGELTLGLEDYLGSLASAHETNQYLLGQRANLVLASRHEAAGGQFTVSLFSDSGKELWKKDFNAPDVARANEIGLRLVKPELNKHDDAEDWVVEPKGNKAYRRAAKGNQKIIEAPSNFYPVKVEPPKAKRKVFPFEGYIDFQGLKIDVENVAGSTRKGTGPEGDWSTYMHSHYGEIRGTEGTDGDKLDVYVGPNHDSPIVVVIHQHNPWDGKYDEDKVMVGFDSVEESIGAYKKQYDRPGFYREGEHTAMPIGAFWRWVHDNKNKGKKVKGAQRVALAFLHRASQKDV